jgi:hypothetical protein
VSLETWESFLFGEVGAAAALGRLLFAAVSINIGRIIAVGFFSSR